MGLGGISGHGASGITLTKRHECALSQVGTRPDMTLDVVRTDNNKKKRKCFIKILEMREYFLTAFLSITFVRSVRVLIKYTLVIHLCGVLVLIEDANNRFAEWQDNAIAWRIMQWGCVVKSP